MAQVLAFYGEATRAVTQPPAPPPGGGPGGGGWHRQTPDEVGRGIGHTLQGNLLCEWV
jgi:hypothetical protein